MKTVQAAHAGGPDVLEVVDAPVPVARDGELLVRVAVAGVNFADTMLRRDAYFVPARFPFVPGVEIAGHVAALGGGIIGWKVGDRAAGIRLDNGGGYAEYATLSAALAAHLPDQLSFARATAVLNQGLTAQGIVETASEIAAGATVLVTAAAGGVGGLLVQLTRLGGAGIIVAAASAPAKLDGMSSAVGYHDPDWPKAVRALVGERGVDVVIDAVGGAVRGAAVRTLAQRGRLVFYGAASGDMGITDAVLTQLLGRSASLTGYSIFTSIREDARWLPRTLARLFDLVAAGELVTPLHPPFALTDAAAAHAAMESRGVRGKVLLIVGDGA